MKPNSESNHLGLPIGRPVVGWHVPPRPSRVPMVGRHCRLEPLSPQRHAADLCQSNEADRDGRMWTYLPYGPFADNDEYRRWLEQASRSDDPLFFAIIDTRTGIASGVASYLRIDPDNGSIEVGHIALSPRLQRSIVATEAMFLMMRWAFAAGYRRYEWKCNSLNLPSRRAAARLGFSFEGVFRQSGIVKGRNRDTAWYAAIDVEWPALEAAFTRWLDPSNFDETGKQRVSLATLTDAILVARG
jgi:RimJ/RimL family protein N-acetyltransferase